jgi:quinol monooxygenase YgiN
MVKRAIIVEFEAAPGKIEELIAVLREHARYVQARVHGWMHSVGYTIGLLDPNPAIANPLRMSNDMSLLLGNRSIQRCSRVWYALNRLSREEEPGCIRFEGTDSSTANCAVARQLLANVRPTLQFITRALETVHQRLIGCG